MNHDRTEQLIRDAFADEAARAADPREVLAAVRSRRPRRSYGLVLATAAVVVVVAAVATFVIPKVFRESTPVAGTQTTTQAPPAVTPQNVLVVGTDSVGNTDSIVLVRLAADGATNVISLPRDSWVSAGGTMVRLNQVYRTSGAEVLATAVSDLTGVHVDHWAVADMTAVVDLTTAVGGVEVCLNAASRDDHAGANFPAGKQVLGGDAALAFIRQRHGLPNGDLDRIVRLQAFLRSLMDKVAGQHLPELLAAVRDHLKSDPGLDVVGLVQGMSGKDLRFATIPVKDTAYQAPGGVLVIQVDPNQVKQFVTDLPNTPPPSSEIPCVN